VIARSSPGSDHRRDKTSVRPKWIYRSWGSTSLAPWISTCPTDYTIYVVDTLWACSGFLLACRRDTSGRL